MSLVHDYVIVYDHEPEGLEQKVRAMLQARDGWRPYGPLVAERPWLFQPMVRDEPTAPVGHLPP